MTFLDASVLKTAFITKREHDFYQETLGKDTLSVQQPHFKDLVEQTGPYVHKAYVHTPYVHKPYVHNVTLELASREFKKECGNVPLTYTDTGLMRELHNSEGSQEARGRS